MGVVIFDWFDCPLNLCCGKCYCGCLLVVCFRHYLSMCQLCCVYYRVCESLFNVDRVGEVLR